MLRLTFGPQHVAGQTFLVSVMSPTAVSNVGAGSSVIVVSALSTSSLIVDSIVGLADESVGVNARVVPAPRTAR